MSAVPLESHSLSFWQSALQKQIFRVLSQLQHGRVTVESGDQRETFGSAGKDHLEVVIRVEDPQLYRRMAWEGSLGAAESFLQGEWTCDNLVNFFRILCRNMDHLASLDSGWSKLMTTVATWGHRKNRNDKSGSQRNIAAHYDLSNDFFKLFLDETMMYSSAYYTEPDMQLAEASLAKLDLICQKLDLKPDDHVLEIGTGWGGFAQYAVENYGCRVTTTTISTQQHDYAKQRIENAGLAERVTLLKTDYRDLSGQYDKLVSIEMIEAVGAEFLTTYFEKCESLIKPGGSMLIQSILMPDHRYDRYCRSVDFIQKYIFPGGHLPSVSAVQQALSPSTQLRLVAFEEFAESYAKTLRAWR
ncbi:MAG TPA: SAM-dependent methyltransferase, partial [Planctomycetaceae bacterium]|nr:SAM-dependent methyltransferase [Planctomycetaceae bacterium]